MKTVYWFLSYIIIGVNSSCICGKVLRLMLMNPETESWPGCYNVASASYRILATKYIFLVAWDLMWPKIHPLCNLFLIMHMHAASLPVKYQVPSSAEPVYAILLRVVWGFHKYDNNIRGSLSFKLLDLFQLCSQMYCCICRYFFVSPWREWF